MTLEQQIADILDEPCGHEDYMEEYAYRGARTPPRRLRVCHECLPKRIAAAIEAAAYDSIGGKYDTALAALRGEA